MINKTIFNGSPKPTVGLELELFTIDKNNLGLTNGAPKILKHFQDNIFFKEELLQCIVEITTDVCNHPKELINDIAPKINEAINYSEKYGDKNS